MKTHRDTYPEQYTHPLCGKVVSTQMGHVFTVYRVVQSRFGSLAMSEQEQTVAHAVGTLEVLQEIPAALREQHEGVAMPTAKGRAIGSLGNTDISI